jgi:site-specific DNA recombinase
MEKVAIYTRISADRTGEALGVERQEQDCRALAERKGFQVLTVITDNDTSAYRRTKKRKGWEEVKALVGDGAIEGIITWHTDRLYRHPSDLEDIINLVEERNLKVHTVTAGEIDLNTASGRLVARLLGSVARNEVEHKAERQSRKMLESAESGRYSGGRLPLGYSLGETKGTLVINEKEAQVLRESCRRLLAGQSLVRTSQWAAEELGRPIRPVTLKTALTSDLITGFRQHVPQAERDRWAARRAKGEVSGEPTGKVYKADWEPILDKPTSDAIRSVLLDPARRRQGRRPVKSLLSSLLHCANCGTVMAYSQQSYKCAWGSGGCGKVAVSTRAIEGLITEIVRMRLENSDIQNMVEVPAPLNDAQKERQRLEEVRSKFYDLNRLGQMSYDDLVRQTNAITEQLKSLDQSEEENVRARTNAIQMIQGASRWDELGIDERRHIIRFLYPGIVITPTGRGHRSGATFDANRVRPVSRFASFTKKPMDRK